MKALSGALLFWSGDRGRARTQPQLVGSLVCMAELAAMLTGLLRGVAVGLALWLPFLIWPSLALRASKIPELAAKGDPYGRAWLVMILVLVGGVMGLLITLP
jgi:hypothetical protein